MQKTAPRIPARTLAMVAILVAAEIVLSRFLSISTPHVKIGFGFAAIALCAMLAGPAWAAVAAALADIVGALLFPVGPYFPGFTLTAALTGLLFGLLLYKKGGPIRSLVAAAINCLVLSLLLNTLWIHLLYGSPWDVLFYARIAQNALMLPVQALTLWLLCGQRVRRLLPKL